MEKKKTKKKDKEYHWYNFTFLKDSRFFVSMPLAFEHKRLTQKNLNNAKKKAGVNKNSVLISCPYLGKMSIKTFKDEKQETNDKKRNG